MGLQETHVLNHILVTLAEGWDHLVTVSSSSLQESYAFPGHPGPTTAGLPHRALGIRMHPYIQNYEPLKATEVKDISSSVK